MTDINPLYTTHNSLENIKLQLSRPFSLIVLAEFLTSETYAKIETTVHRLAFTKTKIPHKYSYRHAPLPKKALAFFHSEEFLAFLGVVLGEPVDQITSGGAYCFSCKEYTLLHDDMYLQPGIDIIFDCTLHWDPAWGGSVVYLTPEGEKQIICPSANQLVLVRRPEGIQRYIHYVNHHAQQRKRHFLLCTHHP